MSKEIVMVPGRDARALWGKDIVETDEVLIQCGNCLKTWGGKRLRSY